MAAHDPIRFGQRSPDNKLRNVEVPADEAVLKQKVFLRNECRDFIVLEIGHELVRQMIAECL